ncbi:hypothetical protein NZK33_15780 [Cyanobium sp. FGCU-6]|jgi:hypothetical protein|nr:hypothetical protein [Cyanobium sp. FGCU6]
MPLVRTPQLGTGAEALRVPAGKRATGERVATLTVSGVASNAWVRSGEVVLRVNRMGGRVAGVSVG